ncbi:MAG: tRNA (adenosine(37)-N6)-threonylcarbamoyltransferase complex ATPase subunit type 1 TsaE [Longimonas sp.]|uniref:tRNA (adenosine(37)-N6)-threonylcarbamoyltransferase complex ATPase subunit type 1 TsaE n=1 Tax=Longimonas sp. TaxID=2039626 RepID=UPI003974D84E
MRKSNRWTDLLPLQSTSPEATYALGEQIAERAQPGDVIALHGDLGAGKTHLVKGIGAGLGYNPADIRSPTFTLVHAHEGGRLPLYHIDAYRLGDPAELHELGADTYLYGEGVCCIEWPSRMGDLLPSAALHVQLTHEDRTTRHISRLNTP